MAAGPESAPPRVWPGRPYPLGATWDGEGVNFALFSEHATSVELCLFDAAADGGERQLLTMPERTDHVWHCYLPDARPGQLYGYRVHGPYEPERGHRFNPAKLMIDPYARALSGSIEWSDALFAYRVGGARQDLERDQADSAGSMPKCVVVDDAFDWEGDRAPATPWTRTVIYECHVKGMTVRHPEVAPALRGTYLGLCADPMLEYLTSLGVTAVELLPVQQHVVDYPLPAKGLVNYWGYNTIGFFAPDVRFASRGMGAQVTEFKAMVKRFHAAGIEVLLDVVYNHTGEGDHLGPTLSLKGIDNAAYFRLEDNPRFYTNFTGTGNTLDSRHPRTLQLVMDSLRYWVTEMHVDGFRFDLAPVLARELFEVDRLSAFFDIIQQDPVLSRVKLIAEPWDVGPGGYQLGNFPVRWAEWNAKYRDALRRFWRGDRGMVSELASRLSGSADLFQWNGRDSYASVNYVVSHDGYTLRDLVSYERKHNEANGEHNRDGHDDNLSDNWGVEGDTDDVAILDRRYAVMKAMLASIAFSQGVPMLAHGDEIARTQRGNNNAYCQDNELSWMDWRLDARQRELLEFTRAVFALRAAHPALRRRHYFRGSATGEGRKDVTWIRADGQEMQYGDWHEAGLHALGMLIDGEVTDEKDERGQLISGDTMLLLVNGGDVEVPFRLPRMTAQGAWSEMLDTARGAPQLANAASVSLAARGLMLLRHGKERRPAMAAADAGDTAVHTALQGSGGRP